MTRVMSKTILVCGFGPGISTAVAEKFGAEGYAVGIVSRSKDKLDAGVKALGEKGIVAKGFACDLGDPSALGVMVKAAREALGPIHIVQWTAYTGSAGDLLTADKKSLDVAMDVAVIGLITAVQTALPDLKANAGSILVTNGGLSYQNPQVDAMAVSWNAMGLALASAAKSKLVGLLSAKLKDDGIYVGQVIVMGAVKGTSFDQGNATLEASTIADAFWDLHQKRTELTVEVKG